MLLATGVLAPSSASAAGCAHPSSLLRSGADGGIAHFDFLAGLGVLPHRDEAAAPARKPAPSPCPGGVCSRAPILPLAPAASPAPTPERWLCLIAEVPPAAPAGSLHPADGPLVRPSRRALAVFHPPRPVRTPLSA